MMSLLSWYVVLMCCCRNAASGRASNVLLFECRVTRCQQIERAVAVFKLDKCWQEAGWRPLLDGQYVSNHQLQSYFMAFCMLLLGVNIHQSPQQCSCICVELPYC